MKTAMEKVRGQALKLHVGERASLAHELILSLESPSAYTLPSSVEREIARRAQSVREGAARSRRAEDVFADIEAKRP
ncbi:MAG: addiction module protein [Kiritimatiellae bacterium]|nr:addiction module protein [Kiritimatiellia bacterium]